MALFKCKMCGGSLEITEGATVIECDYCGTQQTLPKLDDDKRANMYDRANHFRRNNEYDKAMGIYENILNEDNTDAEAYWSLVLCRYGIEYVEDPTPRFLMTITTSLLYSMQTAISGRSTRQKPRQSTKYKKVFLPSHRRKSLLMYLFATRKAIMAEEEPPIVSWHKIYTIS